MTTIATVATQNNLFLLIRLNIPFIAFFFIDSKSTDTIKRIQYPNITIYGCIYTKKSLNGFTYLYGHREQNSKNIKTQTSNMTEQRLREDSYE